ncbi:MAG: hypothetical protein K8S24_05390 [Candidatus Aegiribacteria sp.]|nr:hypothetical protein [Candidatus Aegiribacteria sp.]
MKRINSITALVVFALEILSIPANANDPTNVPWPVGSTLSEMNQTKTIMNSYGEPNTWSERRFHSGIDIDALTETGGDGDEVRCVINGVYLLQCSIGSEVSTGSFVVRRD